MRRRIAVLVEASLLSCLCTAGLAQGVQTGTIRGMVMDQQRLAVPGVVVTATSRALQGPRRTVTDRGGSYVMSALPPGDYQITFRLTGFATLTRSTTLPLGLTIDQTVMIFVAGVVDIVGVFAEAPVPATSVGSANFRRDEIEALPNPRTIVGIAQLSPAVSEAAPNANALVINGAFSFDNAFLINGVDVNDNVFATPQNLFVEDAIEETQVLTSGISAQFGRFSGGVINAITKSGGNNLSGSARVNFSSPSWVTPTPFEMSTRADRAAHPNSVQAAYEGTLGGPIVKDRLWFFASGRYESVENPVTLQRTGTVLVSRDQNARVESKLTGTVAGRHTIQGGYLSDPRKRTNDSGAQTFVIDPHSEVDRRNPNWYFVTNYHGVFENTVLAEAQYAERRFSFLDDGGTGTDLVRNSPMVGTCYCTFYNAPYFDATDPEERNNRQLTGSIMKHWNLAGRHDTKGGYEFFRSQRTGGNSQSPTSYVFGADFLTDKSGAPVLDSTGRPIPVFVPGVSFLSYFPAIKNAVIDNDSHSFYVQDHWATNGRWSADLGARFEHVTIVSTGAIVSVDSSRVVPRLAAAYDLTGNGNHIVRVSYGQYSGRYNEAQLGKNSPVGNPPEIDAVYQGPRGQGYNFAAGFDPTNYPHKSVWDPTQNVKIDRHIKSPLTHELTATYGVSLFNGRGHGEVAYVTRTTDGIIEAFQTTADGVAHVVVNGISAGTFTNIVYRNTGLAHRRYRGLVFQLRYRISNGWTVSGHYTLQLENDGNYEGEGTNTPGTTSFIGNYPEAFTATRNFPDGRLQDFQRSRLRIWSIFDFGLGAFGRLSVSGLWRVDSARVYSLAATNQPLTATQTAILAAAGYPDLPSQNGNEVFFGTRGSQFFKGYGLFDASIRYDVPVFRTLRAWVKLDIFNLFNNQKLIAWNTTVVQNPMGAKDDLGLATTFISSPEFGMATGNTVTNLYSSAIGAYPAAFGGAQPGGRTVRVAVGLRF